MLDDILALDNSVCLLALSHSDRHVRTCFAALCMAGCAVLWYCTVVDAGRQHCINSSTLVGASNMCAML